MGIFGRDSVFGRDKGPKLSDFVVATVVGRQLICRLCDGKIHQVGRYKLETTMMVNMAPSFAEDNLTLICANCGHLEQFSEQNKVEWSRIAYTDDGKLDLATLGPPQRS